MTLVVESGDTADSIPYGVGDNGRVVVVMDKIKGLLLSDNVPEFLHSSVTFSLWNAREEFLHGLSITLFLWFGGEMDDFGDRVEVPDERIALFQ